MSSVGLTFVGAALFVNGLLFLGQIDAKTAGVFNLFVGVLQTAIPFYLIATATSTDQILSAAGIFMFGFTYLYVGINNLAGFDGNGLGWYSAWVSMMAIGFGVTNIVHFHDTALGLLWLQWSVLWGLFFVVIGLGKAQFTKLAGTMTLIMSFTTCTVPGFVFLLGDTVPAWVVGIFIAGTVVALAPLALRAFSAVAESVPAPAEPTRTPVAVA